MIPDRPLRVLMVSRATGLWGAERRILSLAPLLHERGLTCILAALPETPLARAWIDAGFSFRPLRLLPNTGLRRPDGRRPGVVSLAHDVGVTLSSARRIARLARDSDLMWSNSLGAHLEVALAARLARRPAVLHLHDIVAPGLGRKVLAAAVLMAGHAIALTEAVAACAGPRARRNIAVVHNGVDPSAFAPGPPDPAVTAELGGSHGRRLIGIVGRVDPEKGIETVVRAVARLPARLDARLVVVGTTFTGGRSYEQALRSEAAQLLGDRVRFLPPRDDVPQVMRSLDVLVNASPAEPFGRTVIEAQACGTPVVATRGGGIPEFVTDGVTGLLVPPGDPAAMAAALERVLTDSELRRRLIERALAEVRATHTVVHQADATARVVFGIVRHQSEWEARTSNR